MQSPKIQSWEQTERSSKIDTLTRKGLMVTPFLVLLLLFTLYSPNLSLGVEKKVKKQPAQKETVINDSNVQSSLKKAEEQLKKGGIEGPLRILLNIYDYTKDALDTIKFIKTHYERIINEPSIAQNEKEEILIKLRRMEQLIPKYNKIKETSAYHIGYIYTKKGDSDKARKYLSEVLETTPFSTKPDSTWMKSKTLLLEIFNLEGEF
jgi:tetratricopeptide (TPR) repeat protein